MQAWPGISGFADICRCSQSPFLLPLQELASFFVLPLKEEDVHACQEEYERIDSLVIKHHPQLLVCAMKCTLALYQQHVSLAGRPVLLSRAERSCFFVS